MFILLLAFQLHNFHSTLKTTLCVGKAAVPCVKWCSPGYIECNVDETTPVTLLKINVLSLHRL